MLEIRPTAIEGVVLVRPQRHGDARGFFCETWNRRSWTEAGIIADFVQDNHVRSRGACLFRGLHFQIPPHGQAKLLRVLRGRIFDVVVDLRRGSSTFGRHVAVELDSEEAWQLFVPIGFAHGYLTLSEDCEVLYKVSDYLAPESERGLDWRDPALGISWPVSTEKIGSNERDAGWPRLADLADLFDFEHPAIGGVAGGTT